MVAGGGGGYLGEVSLAAGSSVPATSITGLTPGEVLFGAADGHIDQDPQLFWDTSNAFFGVGTNAPQEALDVVGNVQFTGTLLDGSVPAVRITGLTAGQVLFGGSSGEISQESNLFWDATNNRLGIGTAMPASALQVVGDARATGTVFASNSVQIGPNGGLDRTSGTLQCGGSSANATYSSNGTTNLNGTTAVNIGMSPSLFSDGALTNLVAKADTTIFRSLRNIGAGLTGTTLPGGALGGVLGLGNSGITAPNAAADHWLMWCRDIAAGRASFAMFTEEVVNADAALVSTHSIQGQWNGSTYKIPLVFVSTP